MQFFQEQKKLPKGVRPEEWDRLIKAIPSKDKIALVGFLLAYGSGMRVSEVARCSSEHIRENKSIFIPESKYGVERIVPLPKGWRENFSKLLPIAKPKNKHPEAAAIRMLERKFCKYRDKAELNPRYTFHSLRHGFATRAIEKGIPLNQVQLALGHSNISTTSIYTKSSPQDLLKSYEEKF